MTCKYINRILQSEFIEVNSGQKCLSVLHIPYIKGLENFLILAVCKSVLKNKVCETEPRCRASRSALGGNFTLLPQRWMWSDCIFDNVFVDHLEEKRRSYTTVPSVLLGRVGLCLLWNRYQERAAILWKHTFISEVFVYCVWCTHMNRIATCPRLITTYLGSSGHMLLILAVCCLKNRRLQLPVVWIYEMLHARSCFSPCGTFWAFVHVDSLDLLL